MKAAMSFVVLFVCSAGWVFAAEQTWTGQIGDSMCGVEAKHSLGPDGKPNITPPRPPLPRERSARVAPCVACRCTAISRARRMGIFNPVLECTHVTATTRVFADTAPRMESTSSSAVRGRANAWMMTRPTIPTWEPAEFQTWIGWRPKSAIGGGQMMTPGAYHSFDHRSALGSAFELHERLGKARVQTRIHNLNRQLKEGLRKIKGVQLYTPMSEALSSGIVCFDVGSLPAQAVVDKLFDKGIVASRTPYKASFARLCPSLLTLQSDVETTLKVVAALTA